MASNQTIYHSLTLKNDSPVLAILADSGVANLLIQSATGIPARLDFAGSSLGHRLTGGAIGTSFSLSADNGSGLVTILSAAATGQFTFGIAGADLTHIVQSAIQVSGPNLADHTPLRLVAGNLTGLTRSYMQNSDGSKYYEIDVDFTANLVRHQILLGSGNFTPFQINNLGNTQFNRPVSIVTSSGPMLDLKDGGAFGSAADPHMYFSDGTTTNAVVGFDNSTQNIFRLKVLNSALLVFNMNGGDVGGWTNDSLVVGNASFDGYKFSVKKSSAVTSVDTGVMAARNLDSTNNNSAGLAFLNSTGASVGGIEGVFTNHNTVGTASGDIRFWTRDAGAAGEKIRITQSGGLLIGTPTAAGTGPYIDLLRGTAGIINGAGHIRLADITTNAVGKQTAISLRNALNAEEDITIVYASGGTVYFGGGVSALNAAAVLRFYTAADEVTLSGTEAMRVDQLQSLRVGTTGVTSGWTTEKMSVYHVPGTTGNVSHTAEATWMDVNGIVPYTGSSHQAASFILRRNTVTSDTTDTQSLITAGYFRLRFSVSGGVTYTNTGGTGMAGVYVATPEAPVGALAITHLSGVYVANSTNNTGTNKYGMFVDGQSGATNNWALYTNGGDHRFRDNVRIGNITGVLSQTYEQLSVRRLIAAGQETGGNLAGQFEYFHNQDTGITGSSTQHAIGAIMRRTITTSTSDSSSASYASIGGSWIFSVASGQTYTNAASTVATLRAAGPSLSGGGSLAISHFVGVHVGVSSVNTGTNKYGVKIDAQTGATNNYGFYQEGLSTPNYFEGGLGINAIADGTNIVNFRKDQNTLTRLIFRNTHVGSSAVIRASLSADAGDVNWDAGSVAGGSTWSMSADSTFTGGGAISQGGNNALRLQTNALTRINISGAGLVTIGTAAGTELHVVNGSLQITRAANFSVNGPGASNGISNPSSSDHLHFYTGSTDRGFLDQNGKWTFGATGYTGGHQFNAGEVLIYGEAPRLVIQDGGTFGSNADPTMHFKDGLGYTGATIGYTNAAQSNFRIGSNHGNIIFALNGADVGAWQAADNALVVGDASYNGYKLSVKRATVATTTAGGSHIGVHNTDTTVNNVATIAFVNASTASVAGIDGVNVNHNSSGTATGLLVFWTRNAGSLGERMRLNAEGALLVGSTAGFTLDSAGANTKISAVYDTSSASAEQAAFDGGIVVNTNSPITSATKSGAWFRMYRTASASVTDTNTKFSAVQASIGVVVGGGNTWTFAGALGAAAYRVIPPNQSTGSFALTHYAGLWVQAESINTGTNKYGVLVEDISGATNNWSIHTGTAKTSFGGASAYRKGSDFTSIAAAHSGTTVFPSANGYYRVAGSTAMTIHGIAAGVDGQVIRIWNNSGQNMTFADQSGTETVAANRVVTNSGGSVNTTGDGFAELIYDITAARWVLMYISS